MLCTESVAIWLWSTADHLSLVCLSVSLIWLVENQIFIREHTRRTKKVAWSSTFLRTIFSAWGDFYWRCSWLFACLKTESYTEAEKTLWWKPALIINQSKLLTSCCETENNKWLFQYSWWGANWQRVFKNSPDLEDNKCQKDSSVFSWTFKNSSLHNLHHFKENVKGHH